MASISNGLSTALQEPQRSKWEEALRQAKGVRSPRLIWLCLSAPWNEAYQFWRSTVLEHPSLKAMRDEFECVEIAADEDPALDATGQFILQSLANRSGWPANLFVDPVSQQVVFGASALTLESARELLSQLALAWKADPELLRAQAVERAGEVAVKDPLRVVSVATQTRSLAATEVREWLDPKIAGAWLTPLEQSLDFETGIVGPGEAFQFPAVYKCLLQSLELSNWAEIAAGNLAKSHLCDVIGGGFYRSGGRTAESFVATEKLLAENAELLEVFVQCRDPKGTGFPRQVAADLVHCLLTEFWQGQGFASSVAASADYYRVTPSELLEALEPKQRQPAQMFFGIESAHAVPFLQTDLPMLSSFLRIPPVDLQHLLLDAKKRLLGLRSMKREPARGPRLRYPEALALRALAQATEAGLLGRTDFEKHAEVVLQGWPQRPSRTPRELWAEQRAKLAVARVVERSRALSLTGEVDAVLSSQLGPESVQTQAFGELRWDFMDHLGTSAGALRLQALLDRIQWAEAEGDRRQFDFWSGVLRPMLADALRIAKPLGLYGASIFEAYQRCAARTVGLEPHRELPL